MPVADHRLERLTAKNVLPVFDEDGFTSVQCDIYFQIRKNLNVASNLGSILAQYYAPMTTNTHPISTVTFTQSSLVDAENTSFTPVSVSTVYEMRNFFPEFRNVLTRSAGLLWPGSIWTIGSSSPLNHTQNNHLKY